MPHFSASTIVLLVIVALLFFGPKRLPELGRAVGNTLKEFKKGTREMIAEEELHSPVQLEKENLESKSSGGMER
ncbi:hypothetical protein Back11_48800 [Paenibacillus baekrokdamisoli]|uniref:Sec-independent protein translocase protein TatA n=1 Tax=Paenibacillus baekrokdamisoli TaxID=1712516 RepID=A0A3G9J591_9BACL|nr:twin-arginine translocase TatA/TatE family subunit [Paenibacillus baekrokdamisoli]MBB3068705.1 sec-independent protein translocase protein TatA [Paenibacillus baekrokdamisoli]BBH23535.1 hypothetical protein Back11_48800 [Paenibacillus baekrokdamisoli]